jgi:uncharacterized protein (TIGR02001 family)
MKSLLRILFPLAGCLCAPLAAGAPRPSGPSVSAYATLTSDYRSRGLSQSDGGAAVQAGLDYQHTSGFFTGLWASTVDYATQAPRSDPRNSEAEVYAGYNWRSPKWSATTAAARYVYPGTSGEYDYNEASAGFGYRDRLFVTASYTDALLSIGPPLLDTAVTFAVPLPLGIELGGTLGRVDSDAFWGGRYTYWNTGVSRPFGHFGIDLRFYDNNAAGYGLYGEPLPDQWVLSLSYGFTRR